MDKASWAETVGTAYDISRGEFPTFSHRHRAYEALCVAMGTLRVAFQHDRVGDQHRLAALGKVAALCERSARELGYAE